MMDSQNSRDPAEHRSDGALQHHAMKRQQRQSTTAEIQLPVEPPFAEVIEDTDCSQGIHASAAQTHDGYDLDALVDIHRLESDSFHHHGVSMATQTYDGLPSWSVQQLAVAQSASMFPSARGSVLWQRLSEILVVRAEPETILLQAVQALGEAFATDCFLVVWSGHGAIPQVFQWWQTAGQAVISPLPQVFHHPVFQDWITKEQPGIEAIADFADLTPIAPLECAEPNPVRAMMGSSTWFQGQRNGLICLTRSHPNVWSAAELTMLQTITDQVAVVISQVNLQRQSQQQARCQGLIEQLTIAIRNAQDLNQILNLATVGIAQVLQVERSFLITLKYADPMLKSRSVERAAKTRATVVCEWLNQADQDKQTSGGANEPSWLQQSFWVADCAWCQQVFLDPTQPLAIADQQQAANPANHYAPIFEPEHFPAALIIPLESQGTVLGFLVLQHPQVRSWQPEEIMWAELVAAQVSTAMIQAQTLRQVQGLVEERTAQLQRSLEVQAKLYERTRRQVDQLRHLNQLKDEFLSTMSHELRTPLTSMTLAIRMLRQPGIAPERHQRYLDILEQQCNQETNLINDLLALQKLESNQAPIQLQKVDFRGLVHDLTACFEDQWAAKGLALALDLPERSLMVQTDFDSLNRILIELLNNAGKYADSHTTVALSLAHQLEAGVSQTVMTLRNIGHGISAEELPYIFDKFRRGRGVTQQAIQGTGLGLALVKCLVQHLNGTITVASQVLAEDPNRYETCFTLILPSIFHSEAP